MNIPPVNIPVGIVIVLYNPAPHDLERLYALARSVRGAVVDNSETPLFDPSRAGRMTYIALGRNCGIAHAQNAGISALQRQEGIDYIIFLDQDSSFSVEFIERLYHTFQNVSAHRLAALGPQIIDEASDRPAASPFHPSAYDSEGLCLVREIISSGSIVRKAVFDEIGLMDDSLFIDYVDFEWCWRARSHGYSVGRTANVSLPHTVGRRTLRLGRYEVPISAPQRYYYQFRNFLWLSRRRYVPFQWKMATGIKTLLRFFYIPFITGCGTMKHILRGLKDGLLPQPRRSARSC